MKPSHRLGHPQTIEIVVVPLASCHKTKKEVKMKTKEEPEGQEVKILILKCEKCGEEYIFDSTSRICPECGGILQKKEAVLRL